MHLWRDQTQVVERVTLLVLQIGEQTRFYHGPAMSGTLALSWGPWGGLYLHRARICLGWLALTYVPIELDALMRAYADKPASDEGRA